MPLFLQRIAAATAAVFLLFHLAVLEEATGQIEDSTSAGYLGQSTDWDETPRFRLLVDPFAVYSNTYGFGLRTRATVRNLLVPSSRIRLTAWASQRRGQYSLAFLAPSPLRSRVFLSGRARFETFSAHRYYGTGPFSSPNTLLFVSGDQADLLLRVGFQALDGKVLVQPFMGYGWYRYDDFEERDEGAFASMTPASQEHLMFSLGAPAADGSRIEDAQIGLRSGIEGAIDLRDRWSYPLRGILVQGSWMRYWSESTIPARFDRYSFTGHGFLRITGSHVLAIRTIFERTNSRGDVPIPFYLLPELDLELIGGFKPYRFVGHDLFVANAEYRWPINNLEDVYQISAFLQVGAGAVYDDIFDDFKLKLSLDAEPGPTGSVPLRPGLGVGLRVSALEQGRDMLEWMVGFSPDGFTLAAVRWVKDLRDIY